MPKTATTSVAARNLATLRLIILKISELQQIGTRSTGFSTQGHTDLSFIFPRTATLAAANHAAAVARLEHDDKVRARGVYHLFRLPTYWEGLIHRAWTEGFSASELTTAESPDTAPSLLKGLPDLHMTSPPPQGPVDLGKIDLTSPRHLATLAGHYLSALRAKQSVIPFFRLSEA
jgi:hypothetical protein